MREKTQQRQAESQSKAQISIYMYNEKNHYSKTGAESIAGKGVGGDLWTHGNIKHEQKIAATMLSRHRHFKGMY